MSETKQSRRTFRKVVPDYTMIEQGPEEMSFTACSGCDASYTGGRWSIFSSNLSSP